MSDVPESMRQNEKRGREISRPRRSGRISEDWEILQNQRHAVNQKLYRDMSFL